MVSGGGEQSAVGITRGGGRTSTHGGVKGVVEGLSLRTSPCLEDLGSFAISPKVPKSSGSPSEIDFSVHFRFELWGPKFLLLRG